MRIALLPSLWSTFANYPYVLNKSVLSTLLGSVFCKPVNYIIFINYTVQIFNTFANFLSSYSINLLLDKLKFICDFEL